MFLIDRCISSCIEKWTQEVVCPTVIKPIPERVEAMLDEVFGCAEVEPRLYT